MTAIGYIRVSTQGQKDDGVSPAAQEDMIRGWCRMKGLPEPTIKGDLGRSGFKMKNRPGLQETLSTLKKGDILIVYSLSRFSRSVKECMNGLDDLRARGIEFVSLSENLDSTTATGKACIGIIAVFAQLFRDQIAENTKSALDYKRENGEKTGGRTPYGFDKIKKGERVGKDGEKKTIWGLTPNPQELSIIDSIRTWRKTMSLTKICKWLDEMRIPTKTGGSWHPSTVAGILKRQ